jgi:hypothetical protein
MNTPRLPASRPPTPHPGASSKEARDWAAQERALSPDAPDRHDALLVQALRSMPLTQPPIDFAVEVARLARIRMPEHAAATRDDGRIERVLQHGLLGALVVAALAVLALYGGQWLALADQAFGAGAVMWTLACAACAALSWSLGWMRRWAGTRSLSLSG